MTRHLYLRLAAGNIRGNRRFYIPFLLTAALTVACFYIMCSTGMNQTLPGGGTVPAVMHLGVIVVGIFSVIFLYYTNSFLIKRRKKELGLYNILGMEKRHIAKVLAWETFLSALISVGAGLALGLLVDKLMFLLLLRILHFDVTMAYVIQPIVLAITAALFFAIFALILVANLSQVVLAKPIELLHGGDVGEKEPKAKWPLVVIGVLCLGSGYYLAIATKDIVSALMLFFVAVILVIIGTYCLFLAGSIAVLKLLKKNKNYYYKSKHFVSVSGMLYRMKQNAAGLANICILSTMVLVTVSTTVSLYGGMQDILDTLYPYDMQATFTNTDEAYEAQAQTTLVGMVDDAGLELEKLVCYPSVTKMVLQDGDTLFANENHSDDVEHYAYVGILTADGWASLTGGDPMELGDHEVGLGVQSGSLGDTFTLLGEEYTVAQRFETLPKGMPMASYVSNVYYLVVSDRAALEALCAKLNDADPDAMAFTQTLLAYDLSGTDAEKKAVSDRFVDTVNVSHINEYGEEDYYLSHYTSRQDNTEELYAVYGGFLFLGIFLGALFLMATVLIIYYKQIIEGYDDRSKYEIMRKVGMSKKLISSSVHSQILTMFLLPLGAAAVHLGFAFPMLSKALQAMSLYNTSIFFWCTLITFAVFVAVYVLVYAVTSRVYYRIVSGQEHN